MDDTLSLLHHCELCPRKCGIDRLKGEKGFCGAGDDAVISHYGPHFGEEPPISGTRGSGNIFFSPCNLRCIFCQNHQISHRTLGSKVPVEGLVDIFFELERAHVHNINLVSPTPYLPQIASAISAARSKGISIPFIYNTNAYESADALRRLRGLVDIYLPDFKYWNDKAGDRLSSAPHYRATAQAAILEMKSQVGDLDSGERPATRGLLVRHLVLPGMVAATEQIVRWVRAHLGKDTFVSLMAQYHPVHRAHELPLLRRSIRQEEYERAMQACTKAGLDNVFVQELESASLFLPDFEREEPFNRNCSEKQRVKSGE